LQYHFKEAWRPSAFPATILAKEKAMMELTPEQRQALATTEESPAIVIDPQTHATYALLPREAYERLKTLLATDEYDLDERAACINEVMAEDDAGDPLLESYQHYWKPQ
jgi:hypothetical protein